MLLAISLALAGELDDLLARGEMTLVETEADGTLRRATAMGLVAAPVDAVWSVLVDFAAYPSWMPSVRTAKVTAASPTSVTVTWTLSVVGPDITFTQDATLDAAAHTVQARQTAGALPGSRWDWQLEPRGGGTLVRRVVRTRAVDANWLLRQVDDQQHTLDIGINAAAGVVEVKALKRRLGG